jgi:hypothetical protein
LPNSPPPPLRLTGIRFLTRGRKGIGGGERPAAKQRQAARAHFPIDAKRRDKERKIKEKWWGPHLEGKWRAFRNRGLVEEFGGLCKIELVFHQTSKFFRRSPYGEPYWSSLRAFAQAGYAKLANACFATFVVKD